jgi:hypothetical protein
MARRSNPAENLPAKADPCALDEHGVPNWARVPMPPDEAAWRSWCGGCTATLSIVLMGSDRALADWARVKARAWRWCDLTPVEERRVVWTDGDGIRRGMAGEMTRPQPGEAELADELVAFARRLRSWLLTVWTGQHTPAQILDRLTSGRSAEVLHGLVCCDDNDSQTFRRCVGHPSAAALGYAAQATRAAWRGHVSPEERMAHADAWAKEVAP